MSKIVFTAMPLLSYSASRSAVTYSPDVMNSASHVRKIVDCKNKAAVIEEFKLFGGEMRDLGKPVTCSMSLARGERAPAGFRAIERSTLQVLKYLAGQDRAKLLSVTPDKATRSFDLVFTSATLDRDAHAQAVLFANRFGIPLSSIGEYHAVGGGDHNGITVTMPADLA